MSSVMKNGLAAGGRVTQEGQAKAIRERFLGHLEKMQWRSLITATRNDLYLALAYTVRDELVARGVRTADRFLEQGDLKMVCYLSAEFLMGPHLGNNLINLEWMETVKRALEP